MGRHPPIAVQKLLSTQAEGKPPWLYSRSEQWTRAIQEECWASPLLVLTHTAPPTWNMVPCSLVTSSASSGVPLYPLGSPVSSQVQVGPCSTCSPHPTDTQGPSQVLGKPIQRDRMVGPEFRGRDR